jgi:ABC-2 type transport system ATP-binding protein
MLDVARAIQCSGLRKIYADVVAVDGLDLEVRVGECFGLLGPNGAGKTTTVEILEGLLESSGGTLEILGRRWDRDEAWLRERLGVSLQETHLPDRLTVRETLTLFRSFFAAGRDVDATLDLVALREKEHARYTALSGGQRQRLAVACALVGDPRLLFLDEPTTGLDPQSRRSLWDVILAFKASGGSVLLTTHYMDEAERLCDRVGIIDRGKMIAVGTPKELIDSLGGSQIVEITLSVPENGAARSRKSGSATSPSDGRPATQGLGQSPMSNEAKPDGEALARALAALGGVRAARPQQERVILTVEQLHLTLPLILETLRARGIDLANLSTHQATLEDVFMTLTGRALRE